MKNNNNNKNKTKINIPRASTAGEVADEIERRFHNAVLVPGGSRSNRVIQGVSKPDDAVKALDGKTDGKTSFDRTDPLLKGFS